jgi:hypothetical protein
MSQARSLPQKPLPCIQKSLGVGEPLIMDIAGKFFTPEAMVNLILYGALKHRAGYLPSLQCLHERWCLWIVPGSTSRAYPLFMKGTNLTSYTARCWHSTPLSRFLNFYPLAYTNPHLHITTGCSKVNIRWKKLRFATIFPPGPQYTPCFPASKTQMVGFRTDY